MVFSSYSFLFLFLPVVLTVFFVLGRRNEQMAAYWLLLSSLFYYVSWDYRFLPILLTSILCNYLTCTRILAVNQVRRKKIWLTVAIAFNLLLLGYFKYANFFISTINNLTGNEMSLLTLLLPVGISFFTFTQISLLVDAYHGKMRDINLGSYALFVSYFPYIVAGPVLHHRDMLPQFTDKNNYRPSTSNFAVGVTLFVFGAAKKLLIADNLVPMVDVAFADDSPQLIQAWLGLFAYTLQLYFDFSGYSDMAIGISRLFGFHIPFNFNSPYKAASVSEFWLRWHISLSRFLRNYLYIPLGGNRNGQMARYRNLLLTMLLGGLWHGSNWTFVIWGGLHGLYLCVEHGWRHLTDGRTGSGALSAWFNRALTFQAIMIAWCFFRAPDAGAAFDILAGMIGKNGISPVTDISSFSYLILGFSTCITFFMPNTNEVFAHLESRFENSPAATSILQLRWIPTLRWGLATGIVLAFCLLSMEKAQDFIYAQF